MSAEERVELVRRGFAAYNDRDIDALFRVLDPEIEIFSTNELANPGTFHGHEGFLAWVGPWNEAWEDFQNIPVQIEPVGERHAVARVRAVGRGRGSGIEVEQELAYVYDIEEDVCVYLGLHASFEAGLREAREREGIPGGADDD